VTTQRSQVLRDRRGAEVQVAEKRGLDGVETMAFVRGELAMALETFAPLQEEPLASTTVQMVDLGTYPLHAIVDMFTFDITTHLRYDIVKPRGPIEVNLRSLDERQLGPAVSWLLAGIPRMQRKLPQEFAGPLGLDLTGPAGTRVTINSDGAAITVTPRADSAFEPRAVITSSTDDFLAWSTTRLPASSTPSTSSRGATPAARRRRRDQPHPPQPPVDRPATGPDPDHLPTASQSSAGSLNH